MARIDRILRRLGRAQTKEQFGQIVDEIWDTLTLDEREVVYEFGHIAMMAHPSWQVTADQ